MNLDDFVKQSVEQSVRAGLQDTIGQIVAEILEETAMDPTFQEQIENMTTESVHKALIPREEIEHQFKSPAEFVDKFIRPYYATTKAKQDTVNWSKRWYKHPEVVARLDTLWRTYERMRAENREGFLEAFLRNHADYHMKQIMSDNAVFASCTHTDTPSVPLPSLPPEPKQDPSKTAKNTE